MKTTDTKEVATYSIHLGKNNYSEILCSTDPSQFSYLNEETSTPPFFLLVLRNSLHFFSLATLGPH